MRRIMIIGGPASGKSTLARAMGARLGLPVFHMDHIHWRPGWIERSPGNKMALVKQVVAQEAWVFEGGHSASNHLRLARADLLIWLDVPVTLRLWRAARRTIRDRGRVRPDMQRDCPETVAMLPAFLRFIWTTHRSSRAKARASFQAATIPKHRLTRLAEINTYLETLT
ncbi:MAG: hypothetical protein CML66_30240 [Rhodobacteraceae bacterium]|nr:hypothetical protein [Paracoccaceae bacterium]MAY44560.1 hypothetical protein [Paracoccaceae bacterium]